ncbi:hypothetical protein Nmel_006370 [Mimus melanotis]
MSKRKGEKGIDLKCFLDTLKCFGRGRELSAWEEEEEGQAGGRRSGVITYCPAHPGVPESPGGATSSRAALLALVLPGMASRLGAALFLITERCRGLLWSTQTQGIPAWDTEWDTHLRSLASCGELRDNISLPHLSPA